MKRRKGQWVLPMVVVLLAALSMGGVSMWLLVKESKRLESIGEDAIRQQAEGVAIDMGLIVTDMKEGVMEALSSFESDALHNLLLPWVRQNSLVEFAFAYDDELKGSLSYYPADIDLWIRPLLKSDDAWLWGGSGSVRLAVEEGDFSRDKTWESPVERPSAGNYQKARSKIREENLASKQVAQAFQSTIEQTNDARLVEALEEGDLSQLSGVELETRRDWRLVEQDGVERWIGFVEHSSKGVVAGASLNLDLLQDRLAGALPEKDMSSSVQYTLWNGRDEEVATTRLMGRVSGSLYGQSFSVALGEELPGWRLEAFPMESNFFSSAFLLVTGLLIAALVVAVVLGGVWLGLQSRSSALEAARRSSFVSNVSHELKTPLTTIRMYAELLEGGRVADEGKRSRYLSTISAESQRLSRLVNNVLDFSRLERGKSALKVDRQDVSALLASLLEMRREELAGAGIEVDVGDASGEVWAFCDRDGFMQIVSNLVDNVIKYAKEGGWIGFEILDTKESVELRVRDRGEGVSRGRLKHLFEPFERGDDRLVATQSGCGLGLSIARGLAEEMGGGLSYRAAKRGGACFVLKLKKESGER